ncbi:MAG TPA: molybdenum cofactor guanylyltransferase [Terriglobales bacterium]|nr:molybdenum cofactor guanylyltransferase [Terriglobales bacterium]
MALRIRVVNREIAKTTWHGQDSNKEPISFGLGCAVVDLTAFVLAGGKSTRMGTDKAFLRWHEGTLLEHALALARELTPEVRIVAKAEKFAHHGVVVIEDIHRDCGPLGGIHAALSTTPSPWNLILAVDLPLLNRQLLSYLLTRARESQATVTVPKVGARLQPLCAVYRREFAEVAKRSLEAGENKIDLLFAKVRTQVIEEEQLFEAGFSRGMFRNVNTPQDLEEVSGPSVSEA